VLCIEQRGLGSGGRHEGCLVKGARRIVPRPGDAPPMLSIVVSTVGLLHGAVLRQSLPGRPGHSQDVHRAARWRFARRCW
jgi:hypothetical protein